MSTSVGVITTKKPMIRKASASVANFTPLIWKLVSACHCVWAVLKLVQVHTISVHSSVMTADVLHTCLTYSSPMPRDPPTISQTGAARVSEATMITTAVRGCVLEDVITVDNVD